jgi:hypothetical protein
VRRALDAGADRLAHTPWSEELEPGLLRACAEQTVWISTIDIHGWGAPTPARALAVRQLGAFLAAGGRVRYGTDQGNGPLPAGVNPREIRALQEAGLGVDDVLACLTDVGGGPVAPCVVPGVRLGPNTDPGQLAADLATAVTIGCEPRDGPLSIPGGV